MGLAQKRVPFESTSMIDRNDQASMLATRMASPSPVLYQHEGAHPSLDSSCEQSSWSRSENGRLRLEVEWGPRQEDPCSGVPIAPQSLESSSGQQAPPAAHTLLFHFSPPNLENKTSSRSKK